MHAASHRRDGEAHGKFRRECCGRGRDFSRAIEKFYASASGRARATLAGISHVSVSHFFGRPGCTMKNLQHLTRGSDGRL